MYPGSRKEVQLHKSQIEVMDELLQVYEESDVDRLIEVHEDKRKKCEEEFQEVAKIYTEDFRCFMSVFVKYLEELRDIASPEDRDMAEEYVSLFSDETNDRYLLMNTFVAQTKDFNNIRYTKLIKKLRQMCNYWIYQTKTTRERELRDAIFRENSNLKYLHIMKFNMDFKADSKVRIETLQEIIEKTHVQHAIQTTNYQNQIAQLTAENENLTTIHDEETVEIANLICKATGLRNALEDANGKIDEQIAERARLVESTSTEIEKLQAQLDEKDILIAKLESQLSVPQASGGDAGKSDEISALKSQIDVLTKQYQDAEAKVQELTRIKTELEAVRENLLSTVETQMIQEQPNILKETFRRLKTRNEELKSENAARRMLITELEHQLEKRDSEPSEEYKKKIEELVNEKMKLIQQVYELERRLRDHESDLGSAASTSTIALSTQASSTTTRPTSSKLRLDSPELSPRDLTKIKRHSLLDSRRGLLTYQQETQTPISSEDREKKYTQEEWDKLIERFDKDLGMKEEQLKNFRHSESRLRNKIKHLEIQKDFVEKVQKENERLRQENQNLHRIKREHELLKKEHKDALHRLTQCSEDLNDTKATRKAYFEQLYACKERNKVLEKENEQLLKAKAETDPSVIQNLEKELKISNEVIQKLEFQMEELTAPDRSPKKQLEIERDQLLREKHQKEYYTKDLERRVGLLEGRLRDLNEELNQMGGEKQAAEEEYKKRIDTLENKLSLVKKLAIMRRKEIVQLRQLLGLGEEDPVPSTVQK
ncbi:unnamed protein product [Acanthoscelides obtectus]|uniref:Uncharacterized protein n=1 Tax=Acanthoscelides obtectus TaxID=200917 RepID=A0A9P0Q264_ACAOB|nr:unnamed protein product [Acanthoscelides obtectus]CAK1629223.1 hypothetical protein AOBTE_LOCUS5629 [Acanthoscelides obtectus]